MNRGNRPRTTDTQKTSALRAIFAWQLPVWLIIPLMTLMLVGGVGGGFVAAQMLTPPTTCPESPEVCEDFGVFWEAWQLARDHFVDVDALQPKTMTEGAIRGMLDTLGDQGHTRFLTAEEAERWQESLSAEFEGIGAYVDVVDGQTVIVAPIQSSPAEEAGLLSGDVILRVAGEETSGWTVQELVQHVRGPKGTTVELTIQREGVADPFNVDVRRDTVELPSVSWTMLPDTIAFIRLNSFAERSADQIRDALNEAIAQGAESVVLDLRNNGGGLVDEAVNIASQFLPADTTVFLWENRDGGRRPSTTRSGGVALDMPLVVLVNRGTASSSEILSGALQDAKRASIVGSLTTGTGTVLSTYRLQDGSQLLLGTSQWLTPNGRLIRTEGIQPDIEVILPDDVPPLTPVTAEGLTTEELQQQADTQLLKAIEVLTNGE
ncbi:MAG: S41 family peptidase [Chloroflexaceae bacterium]|nr:S41 family peptidase [Chloroflexaceae bacterium]